MRIFIQTKRPIICTKAKAESSDHRLANATFARFSIKPYHYRREVELTLMQALDENLEFRIWEGTKKGPGARVKLQEVTRWIASYNKKPGLDFTVIYLDRASQRMQLGSFL